MLMLLQLCSFHLESLYSCLYLGMSCTWCNNSSMLVNLCLSPCPQVSTSGHGDKHKFTRMLDLLQLVDRCQDMNGYEVAQIQLV